MILINTGLIKFLPQSEETFNFYIRFSDNGGGTGIIDQLKIICISKSDMDEDGIFDLLDNCRFLSNPSQMDSDEDGTGDACDTCPEIPDPNQDDQDNDSIGDLCDNCPEVANNSQLDTDGDGKGNACESSSSQSDKRQGKSIWPYYQFWPQIPGLFSFMPYSFSGYQPGVIYSSLFNNTQTPYMLNIPQGKFKKTTNYGFPFLPGTWAPPYLQTWPDFISSYEQNILPIGFSHYLP